MIKKKPIIKKPIPRQRAPQPQQEGEGEAEAPVQQAPAPAPKQPEDELALQQIETNSYPGENFKRPDKRIKDAPARKFDFDASNLLILCWIALGIFVVGAVWYFFSTGRSSITDTSAPKASTVVGTGTGTGTAAVGPKLAFDVNNPANRAGFEDIKKFMKWAYTDGTGLNGEDMAAKLQKEVPLTGADDPDLREYREKLGEFMRLGKDNPLRPPEVIDSSNKTDLTSVRGNNSPDSLARKKIETRNTELAMMLKGRYK